jgi:alpha-glucosidase
MTVAGAVLERDAPLPACIPRGDAGIGHQGWQPFARHRERAAAGKPLRPILVADPQRLANQLEAGLDLMKEVGAKYVKTGYVPDAGDAVWIDDRGICHYEYYDSQRMIEHHMKVIKAAAARGIAMDTHEPVKDTGLRRTCPNWMSREGARGMEFNAWGSPPTPPSHEPMLAFTALLAGPIDYTHGIFDLRPNERPPVRPDMPRGYPQNRPQTTLANQIAT